MEKQFKPVPDVECLKYHGTPEKPDIKIFVSHRIDLDSETIDNPLYIPVRCGAVYDEREGITMLGDDTGDNISEKRLSFCELTVLYWAWKNIKADYYGLCHYRRYFSFSDEKLKEDIWGNINFDFIDDNAIEKLENHEGKMRDIITKNDMIISAPFVDKKSVYVQYEHTPALHINDLDKCLKIIEKYYPKYADSSRKYIFGKNLYPCSMFIMNAKLFDEYCTFLFGVLEKFNEKKNYENYGQEAFRTCGHLGERLLGIFYIYHCKKEEKLKFRILQRSIFWNTERNEFPEPAFSHNNIPVVLSSSDYYVPYAAVTVLSTLQHASKQFNYDFIFLYNSISNKNKELLRKIMDNYSNVSIRFFYITPLIKKYKFVANNHVSDETFYRLFVQKIFKNYKKIVYLDSDLLVKNDISALYKIDIGDNLIAATPDADWLGQYNGAIPVVKPYCDKKLKLSNPYLYFQAGVLVFNIEEMRDTFGDDELAEFGSKCEYMYVDQDVLNVKCQGRVYFLDIRWNIMSACGGGRTQNIKTFTPLPIKEMYFKGREDPYIIHYAGYLKPWDDPSEDFASEFWELIRGTILYEIILQRMASHTSWQTSADYLNWYNTYAKIFDTRSGARKFADKLLPPGTGRREFAKKLLPKGSLRWRFCKQIYYIFRPKYRPKKEVDVEDLIEEEED
ncbi:DUF4422 domain-containing protein [Pseudoflavonifractor sp. 524-17]|uniref:DUF4422 domain-containing protein n=1 Tax=Pseudoflavonifractor sp. 524-17 TaxID=2304577 RepID=UPI00137AAC9C|nr:DUF4422 domain-containing protein [Pseudoflavonifractor sp. 524-17]NCE65306.1 DUF4422 domain-containing protein [Pseudoflavonifractor sp. 524-17]